MWEWTSWWRDWKESGEDVNAVLHDFTPQCGTESAHWQAASAVTGDVRDTNVNTLLPELRMACGVDRQPTIDGGNEWTNPSNAHSMGIGYSK